MATPLKTELREHGCELSPERFRAMVAKTHARMFPGRTDEEILTEPADAIRLCGAVTSRVGVTLPDNLILRTLLNVRKRGEAKAGAK